LQGGGFKDWHNQLSMVQNNI